MASNTLFFLSPKEILHDDDLLCRVTGGSIRTDVRAKDSPLDLVRSFSFCIIYEETLSVFCIIIFDTTQDISNAWGANLSVRTP